jgi:hypothetical protein
MLTTVFSVPFTHFSVAEKGFCSFAAAILLSYPEECGEITTGRLILLIRR